MNVVAAIRGDEGDLPLCAVLYDAGGTGDVVLNPAVYPARVALGYIAAHRASGTEICCIMLREAWTIGDRRCRFSFTCRTVLLIP